MIVVNVFHRHVADLLPGISANPEITHLHVSLTFLVHDEVPVTAHLPPDQHILTPLRPLPPRLRSVVGSVVAAGEEISNSVVVVAVEGISMTVIFSEETALHLYRAGQETPVRYHARLASQRGEMKDGLTDETRSADPSGRTVNAMSTA